MKNFWWFIVPHPNGVIFGNSTI